MEATGAWPGPWRTALMEQDQLLHCKGPQVGLSLTSGEKSLRILPSQGPAVLGFSLDFPHDSHCGFPATPCPHSSPSERVPSRLPDPGGVESLVFLELSFRILRGPGRVTGAREGLFWKPGTRGSWADSSPLPPAKLENSHRAAYMFAVD